MSKITYSPKNNAYFKNLLEFLQELLPICESLNIKPIIYGSLAYGYYSRDESININDIDVLIPESFFQEISKQATSKGFSYEETNYHSLKIYKD